MPLSIVGKPKNPVCFSLCENGKPPIPYTNQRNAWFDVDVTEWWIRKVFLPAHQQKFGNADCILILDNCPAHRVNTNILPKNLHVIFLPPNMTSNHQPADMGMIASLKVGYKIIMLDKLLEIFDGEGGYEGAARARKSVRKGLRGLTYGGKATLLDAMTILVGIWSVDGKYAREDGIRRCWRKADILPISMNTEINADLGSNRVSISDKTIDNDTLFDLCQTMTKLHVKANESPLDTNSTATALQNSFAAEGLDPSTLEETAIKWIEAEDDPGVIDEICDDELELLQAETTESIEIDFDDDSEPEVEPEEACDDNIFSNHFEAEQAVLKLIRSSKKLKIPEAATTHLDRFRKALNEAKLGKKKKDSTISSFFAKKK